MAAARRGVVLEVVAREVVVERLRAAKFGFRRACVVVDTRKAWLGGLAAFFSPGARACRFGPFVTPGPSMYVWLRQPPRMYAPPTHAVRNYRTPAPSRPPRRPSEWHVARVPASRVGTRPGALDRHSPCCNRTRAPSLTPHAPQAGTPRFNRLDVFAPDDAASLSGGPGQGGAATPRAGR